MSIAYKEFSITDSDSAQIQFVIQDVISDDVANGGEMNQAIQQQYGLGQPDDPLTATGAVGKIKAVVTLPAPPQMTFRFSAQWEKISLGFLGSEMAKVNISDTVKALRDSATTGNTAARDTIAKVGAAAVGDVLVNMFRETSVFKGLSVGARANIGTKETTKQLFREMAPRSFSFSFKLSPKNSSNAEDLKTICKIFRFFMHPFNAIDVINSLKIVNFPSLFYVNYINGFKGHVPLIGACVLTDYSEVYGVDRNGVVALSSAGYPVETNLSLNFTEISLLDRTDISNDGVITQSEDVFK